jgi:hypothetical protein
MKKQLMQLIMADAAFDNLPNIYFSTNGWKLIIQGVM